MTIKRKIQTRTTTNETVEVVSRFDSAVSLEGSDLDAYGETFDEQHLSITGTPTRFEIRPLERQEYRRVCRDAIAEATREDGRLSAQAHWMALREKCFARGVVRAIGVEVERDGASVREDQSASELMAWLPDEYVWEIGGYVERITDYPQDARESDVGKR